MQRTEQLSQILAELGIASDYAQTHGLPVFEEAETRVSAGPNIIGREQELEPVTAGKWGAMRQAAQAEGVELLLVSGYRSYAYQASLIRRKIDAGQGLDEILSVNAPPGCSEHHTGRAEAIAPAGEPPLPEAQQSTRAR